MCTQGAGDRLVPFQISSYACGSGGHVAHQYSRSGWLARLAAMGFMTRWTVKNHDVCFCYASSVRPRYTK